MFSLQNCARILLDEKTHKEWLMKMRNPKTQADMKIDLAKKVIEKCSKMVKALCPRCGYVNGLFYAFYKLLYHLNLFKGCVLVT